MRELNQKVKGLSKKKTNPKTNFIGTEITRGKGKEVGGGRRG